MADESGQRSLWEVELDEVLGASKYATGEAYSYAWLDMTDDEH